MYFKEEPTRQKRCRECKEVYYDKEVDVVFTSFLKGRFTHVSTQCSHCKQDASQASKDRDPWLKKATNTIKYHAKKIGFFPDEFRDKYGWEPRSLAHNMEHTYKNGCTECGHLFRDMSEGLGALTIDIWDRNIEPYIQNTKLMCSTCNKEKGTKTPEEWAIYKATRRRRDRRLSEERKRPKWAQLLLWMGNR